MMEMDAGAAATTSNEEEDGQCAGRRPAKGEMDRKQGGGGSHELPTPAKSDTGGSAKLTEPAKHSTVVVQGATKSIECQNGSQTKKTDPCHSNTTAHTMDSSDGKRLPASTDRTSQLETVAQAPEPEKSLTLPDKVSSKPLLPSTKISVPSSSVPAELPGPSSEIPIKPAKTCPAGVSDATKTSLSSVSSAPGNAPASSGKTATCGSSETQSSSVNSPCPSSSSESGTIHAATLKSPADKLSSKVSLSSSYSKPAGTSSSMPGSSNTGLPEKHSGKIETVTKATSLSQSAPKLHVNLPANASPASSSKPILSRTPAISSPVVSSSTSTKPVIASSIVSKSPSPATLPTVSHSARNAPSSSSSSISSSSSVPSLKTPQSHGPPFKPVPKIPPVMPAVKPKINPPKFSSLVSSSSLQKSSNPQISSSTTSSSNIPKSPAPSAPKPNIQATSRPSLSPNIRPLMSIKVTCPSSFSSSRTSLQYSSHSPFASGSRATHSVSNPVVTSSPTSVTTSSPRAVPSSTPHRVPIGSPRTPSQPVHSNPIPLRPNPSSQSMSSSGSHSSFPSRSPAVPTRHSSPQQPPPEPNRPTIASRASEPLPATSQRREEDRASVRPATDFSVPDVRRDCPSGPDPATPSASLVPDVLRTGSVEEDRHLERMLRPTPFEGGIPPPHMPDLCRRGGETSVAPTRPIVPSSAEADLDLLRPASGGGNPRPRVNDAVHVDHSQPQPVVAVPEASAPIGITEPRSSENQRSTGEGNCGVREESGAVDSNGKNAGGPVIKEDGAAHDNRLGDASCSGTSASKVGSPSKDSVGGGKGVNVMQTSGSQVASTQKTKEPPSGSEKATGDGNQHEQGVCSDKTISDPKESGSDKGVTSVLSDSDASSTSRSASCDSKAPKERTQNECSTDSKSSLPLGKAPEQQSSDTIGLIDKQHPSSAILTNQPQEHPSSSSKGERMTVEKAETDKDSLVGEDNNSSLMILPASANLPKVLVMGDEVKGREGDQPQKEGKEEAVGKEEKKLVKESTSTNDNGSKTAKSHAECDKPVASEEDKSVAKLLDNISPKPPKVESAALSSKASPTCVSGSVPEKDCDAIDSGKVGKKIAILQPEASQESVSLPLPVVKNIFKSSKSSEKSSLDISAPLVGKSIEKSSVTSGSLDTNGSRHEKGGVQLKMVSCIDSPGDLKETDHKADLNAHKATEVVCKGSNKELLNKDKKSVADEIRKAIDSMSHDKSVEKPELKKPMDDCQDHSRIKKNEGSDGTAIQAAGAKDVQKSACLEEKSVVECSRPENRGLCHNDQQLKVIETPAIKSKEDTKQTITSIHVSNKKDLSVSEENKINDKHKDNKVQADITGDEIVKVEEKVVVKETMKMPEKVSLSKFSGEPDLMKESKRSQQTNLESVPLISLSIAGVENQSISVKTESKKKSFSQILGCEPQCEILSKSDKNALVISGDSMNRTDSPSQVQISDEKLSIVDEALKCENLDNNEIFSLPVGMGEKEKSLKQGEPDSSLDSEVNVDTVCSKDSNDLKTVLKTDKVATEMESKPVFSVDNSTLVKSVQEDTSQKSDSINKLEITDKSVDSNKTTIKKNLEEAIDNVSTLDNVHSNKNSKTCDSVPVGKKGDLLGVAVDSGGQVFQGNPLLNPVEGKKIRLPSASMELLTLKPSLRVVGAPEGASQDDKLLVVDKPPSTTNSAKNEKEVQSAGDKIPLNQPTQVLNVVLEPNCNEETKILMNVTDKEMLHGSSKIKVVQEPFNAKLAPSKSQLASELNKSSANNDVSKVDDKAAFITSTSQEKAQSQMVSIQSKKEPSLLKDLAVTTLGAEQGKTGGKQNQTSEMLVSSIQDTAKECPGKTNTLASEMSPQGSSSDAISICSVPNVKESSDGLTENKNMTLEKDKAAVTTVLRENEPDLISKPTKSVPLPKTSKLPSSSNSQGETYEAKKLTKTAKNIPIISKIEANKVGIVHPPVVSNDRETPKASESKIMETSHSMDVILSKNVSLPQLEKVEDCSEKKICESDNISPASTVDIGETGKKNIVDQENLTADHVNENCSENLGTSKLINPESPEEVNPEPNEKSSVETVLSEVVPSSENEQGTKGNLDKSASPLKLFSSVQSIETSKDVTKERESVTPDSSASKPNENKSLVMPCIADVSSSQSKEKNNIPNHTTTIVNKDSKTKVEETDEVKACTNKAESSSSQEPKNVKNPEDDSFKDELKPSTSSNANSLSGNITELKLEHTKSGDYILEQQNMLDGNESTASVLISEVSQDKVLPKVEIGAPKSSTFPDILNVSDKERSTNKNSNDQLEMAHKKNVVEAVCTSDKASVQEMEMVKSAQKDDEVSNKPLEKILIKENVTKGTEDVQFSVKEKGDELDQVESPIKSSIDHKPIGGEPENNTILPPKQESKMTPQDVVNPPNIGESKAENPSVVLNDTEVTDSSKLKKRGDLKHSREKSILGITEKLAVAKQMRQQKQVASDSALKESSSPKKMPGLIEMGVAKASRRKNLIVKDDQRMFKKTKVVTGQEGGDSVISKDPTQPPSRQGMEITLGKSEITLGMGQSLSEMVRNAANPQPEVVIAAELQVTEKTVPPKKEDGVGLDSCTVIDLSSKSMDSPKDSQVSGKIIDGIINPVDRPIPLSSEKHETESASIKGQNNKEPFEVDKTYVEDQKDSGSFKFPRVKRNSGKEKTFSPVVPPSVAGPTTRTRANFKPPSSSPAKSIPKLEESKEKTYSKAIKGLTKRDDKAVDIEIKRKGVEVSTEPFSKPLDAEIKRMDYAEEALSIRAINSPSSGSSSKLLEVIRVAEEKGKDIVKVNDVEVMREPVGSSNAPLSLMRKPPSISPIFSSISVSTEGQRKDSMSLETKNTSECVQTDGSSMMCKFPSGNTESWEFVAKVGEVELLRESPRVTPKATPPPVTITVEPSLKKPTREKESGPRKPGRPSSMPPPSRTPDYTAPSLNMLEQAFMAQQNIRNHSLEVLVGIGNRPGEGSTMDPRAQVPPMVMQMGNSSIPHWALPGEAHSRASVKPTGMETYLAGRKTPVGEQAPESESEKRKKGTGKARNAPPPRWSTQEADMLSVKVDGHSLGTWSPGDWRSLPPGHMWPPGYSGYGPPLRPRGPLEPRCSRSVSPPPHSSRDIRGVEHMPEDLSSPPLPRGRRESPHSFRHPFVHPATSFPGAPSFTNVSVMSYPMSKNNSSALNLAKSTASATPPSDTAMNLTMCRQSPSTPTPPPVISSPSIQQSPRQNFPVNLVKSRSSSPKTPAQQAQPTVPDGRGAVLPGGIVVPNLPLIFGREYAVGSPSTPPSGRISHCSAEESREAVDSAVGQVVRCSSEPPRDHMTERRPRESPIITGFVPTSVPPRTSAACQTNQSIQSFPVPRPSSAMSSMEQVPTPAVSRSTITEANLLPGGVVIPNLYGPNGFRPGEEQWNSSGGEGGRLDPPRSASVMSQHHIEEPPPKQLTPRMPTPIPSVSTTPLPPSSTPPPAPPQKTGPGRRGGRAETPPPDKYNFRIEEAHVVMPGGGHGGVGGKLFACDICSGVYRRAFSLKRHYLRAHINYCHLSERDLSNCGIVVGDRMAVHSGGSGRRPYVHTTLPRSASKSPDGEPERGSGRRTFLRDLFRCHTCGVCFDEKKRLKAHLMEHQCGSNRPSLLRQHAAAHHVLPPTVAPRPTPTPRLHPSSPTPTVYLCAYCDKRFSSAAVRRRHRKLHESSPGPHPCYLCETAEDTPEMPLGETPSFAHLEDLRSHMASVHKEVYHSCALCGERLPTILALEEHAEEHRSRRRATEQSDEEEEEEDAELVRAASAAVAPSTESPRQSEGVQAAAPPQGDEEEFRYTCGVCQKMFTNYVNMCRHRRLAHGAAQTKVVGRKAGAASTGKGQVGGRDSESSSRSQSPVVVSQSSERGHRDLLDGEPSSSSSSSVPSPCPYPTSTAVSANDPETIFYTQLAGNIRENLLNYLDGKLHKQNSSDKRSKEECKGYENEVDEEVKMEPIWEKYNFPKDFQQMSYWDISTQLVVRNNLRKVNSTPSVEPDPEQRPAFPETLALVETSKSGDQANKEEGGLKEDLEEEVVEGEWSGLSGEWVRPRSYICCACASRFCDLWALEDHKLARHPNVWCTHLEVEDGAVVLPGSPKLSPGSASVAVSFLGDLLCRRPLGPKGALLSAPSVPPTLNNGMESPSARCTKCSRVCPSLPDLHSHMLECGGDLAWAAWAGGSSPATSSRRNSRKWRPFGSRRRRQRGRRGMKRNIPSSPVKMHRARHRGTDSDSIQRMIANLPAKRATRRVIQFNEDEIKTRSQATIHSVSFPGNFVRVSGYKAPLGVKGAPPTAAKRGRPPKNPLPPTPLNIEGMAVPSTSMAMPPMGIPSANNAASGISPQGIVKKGRGRPPGSKSRTSTTNPDFTLKRRFGESMGEAYSPEADRYAMNKRSRPGTSPVNQHPIGSAAPNVPGEPYVCKGCGAVFDNASSCERHGKKCVFRQQMPIMPSGDGLRSTSGSIRPVHACPHCGKNFTYATPMEKHVRVCGSSTLPRGPPVHIRRATAPSVLGRPPKAEEEEEVKKDPETQEGSPPPSEEAESPPSEPPQEPDMPQLQKEEPVASPPTKDDDIPVLTPVEPEEEEAVETIEEIIVKDAEEGIEPDVQELEVSVITEIEVVDSMESETIGSVKEVENDVKPLDEPVVEMKEEVVETLTEASVEENLPTPMEPEKTLPEAPEEETPMAAPTEEISTAEERGESPEPEDISVRSSGKRTRGSSSGGQFTKRNKVEEEVDEPVAEVETPKRKGGKKSLAVSTRGRSPKGLRTTRGTRGEDDMTSEGEDKKEKEDVVTEDGKVEEQEDEEGVKVKVELEEILVQIDTEADPKLDKGASKSTDESESLPTDKEEDAEKEDLSLSENRGKRGRRGKYSGKPSAATNEVASKATQEKVDSTPVTPRQGKRKGASLERPSTPKVEEATPMVTPEIEPKVTRGSAIAQSKAAHLQEKEITKEDKGRMSASKKKEEEEIIKSTKEELIDADKAEEEPPINIKEAEEDKTRDISEAKPEAKESEAKAEDSEEEEEEDGSDGKDKEEKDSKLRGTKGSKGKVTKKSHKKKKKQELKREVENFWCDVCEMGYSSAFNLVKHGQSQKHKWNLKLAKEKADAAAKESAEGKKSEEKKGGDEEEGSGEGKVHETGKKGGNSEGKEIGKKSSEERDTEIANAPKCSEGEKRDGEKKVDGEGKTTKKRSDGEVKEKGGSEEAPSDKGISYKDKNEESEDPGILKNEPGGKTSVQDKKAKSVSSEDESVTKGSSMKEKLQEKKSPEKKAQEKKPEKKLPEKKTPEKKIPEKKSPEKNLPEKNLQEKNLQEKSPQEKNLLEKNSQEKNSQEKNSQEKNSQEKNLQEKKSLEKKTLEKKSPEKKSQEKKSPEKKCLEKKSPEKKPRDIEGNASDTEQDNLKNDDKLAVSPIPTNDCKENITSLKEEPQGPSKEDKVKGEVTTPQVAVEESTNTNVSAAADEVNQQEGSKKSPTKDIMDGSLIGQTASERGISGQSDNQPAPGQEAEGSITKVSPEATVAAAPESATVIEGTKNASEAVQCGIWPEVPAATPSQEFVQPPAPPPTNYNMLYEWNVGMVQQASIQQAPPPPPPPPPPIPPQQPNITTHMHPVQQDGWGVYGGWEAPISDPNPPPSPGLWRYQPPNPIPWTEPQHSLSPIPRVPSYEDPPPVTHPSTPNPSPPYPSLGSILDSVNRTLGEDVPGFDSSRIQAGATAPEEEYGGVGLFGEGLAELQRAMGATDEEMAMLQQLGTGPLDFVYDNNAIPANVAYNAAESNDQTGPLPNPELVDLDNQSTAVTITGDGPIEEAETTTLPPAASDSSSYFAGDGRGGKRKRCGPPPSKCKKIAPPPRESNRGWRGGRRLLPTQASLASAHLLISQYEKKEMVCPMCNRHFLGLAALETHVAWVHKVKDAKQHILEGAADGQPSGKKPNPAASNTLRELVAGRAVGGVVVGGGVTSSPTPSRRLPCFVCKELYSDVISLNHHIAQQHLRRRPGEGGAVPEMDGNLKSQMTSALGDLLGKALANMRSRSDASLSLQKPGVPANASKSPLFSTFPKLNLLTKSLDAINKISTTGDSSIRKSFGGPSSSEGASESYSRADASADSPEVALFRREDGLDPSEWSSDGEDSAKGQEAEGQLDEGEIPSFHHICPFCGDRFQRLTSRNRHITWAHRDMTCMDMRIPMPRSCSHESTDFDELLGRGRRDEGRDGSSMTKEECDEVQETGRRHNHHPCPACQLTFLRHSQLEAHLKRAHNGADSPLPDTSDSMMECPICRESMNNFLKLCKHVKTKHREWSINCFTTDMHHHLILRKESPEESMVIRKKFLVKMKAFPVLRMASPTPSSRSSEEESYMDPDPKGNYLCSVCGVNFKSPQGVIRHLNLEHNSNHLEGALPMQKIFPRHATKEYRSRSGGGLGSDIKAKAEAALRELNLSQKLKLGAVTATKGMMAAKLGQSKKPTSSTSDCGNDLSVATTSKGSGRGRGSGRRGRGKRGGARGGISSDVEKSLFDVYEFEDDDDELEETPSRVGSADGSSRVGSECGDDDEDEDGAEDEGKCGINSAASIRGKRVSVDSSSSDAKYNCNACGKGYKSLTAFWKHTKGVRGACAGGGSSPGRSGDRGSQESSAGPSVRSGSKASGGRRGGGGKEEEEAVSSDVESEVGGTVRVLRRLRGSTSGASDIGGTEGSTETLHSSEASEAVPKRGEKGGGRGGKGKRKGGGGVAEEEKKPLFSGGETVRTYGGKRSAKQQAEERRGRGGGGEDGDSAGGSRRSLGASEAAFDALRGGGSS